MPPLRSIMSRLALTLGLTVVVADVCASDGTWEVRASMSVARQETGAACIGDQVYVVGGLLAGFPFTASEVVEIYDIAGDSWSFGPAVPDAIDHAAVVARGSELYVIGGFAGDFVPRDEVWILDTTTGLWSPGPSLPEPRGASWAAVVDETIFLFGGESSSGASSVTFALGAGAAAWQVRTPMPTPREHLVAVTLGDAVHVIGGRNGPATDAHEAYQPATDSWTTLSPLPTARSAMACSVIDGCIHVAGGEVPMLFAVHEIYDPATDSWSCGAAMPVPRHGVAAVTVDGAMFAPGGGTIQGLQPTTYVDVFVPPTSSPFRRGDCNDDGTIDIADPITVLEHLFQGAPLPRCESACDTNDDGVLDVADAVTLLSVLFGGVTLPAPGTQCGDDPTDDPLFCASSGICP